MEGWKTKTGAVLVALAGIVKMLEPVLPGLFLPYAEWFVFAEVFCAAAGAAFMGIGIAHKIEKSVCANCGK
jgi:hypothetical protein